jgi:hypothetical protein
LIVASARMSSSAISALLSPRATWRTDYGSFASFSDPDGNGWLLQEVKQRAQGR